MLLDQQQAFLCMGWRIYTYKVSLFIRGLLPKIQSIPTVTWYTYYTCWLWNEASILCAHSKNLHNKTLAAQTLWLIDVVFAQQKTHHFIPIKSFMKTCLFVINRTEQNSAGFFQSNLHSYCLHTHTHKTAGGDIICCCS